MINATASSRVELLHGHMRNLRKKRGRRDFVFTANDRSRMGATAIAAGLAGLGGAAAGLGSMAMDTTEEADLIEFELDGTSVKAWLWVSMFEEGDEVEVVAEPNGDCWIGYGVRRVSDRIVALHPHCSRGRFAHFRASARWWGALTTGLFVFLYALIAVLASFQSTVDWAALAKAGALGGAGLALILAGIAYRISTRYVGFVDLAEQIFEVFGWPDVRNIDLPAITKKSRKPDDPGGLGILFFRY
jgi:hypothetical protein